MVMTKQNTVLNQIGLQTYEMSMLKIVKISLCTVIDYGTLRILKK